MLTRSKWGFGLRKIVSNGVGKEVEVFTPGSCFEKEERVRGSCGALEYLLAARLDGRK
jgi:hypothetical protein